LPLYDLNVSEYRWRAMTTGDSDHDGIRAGSVIRVDAHDDCRPILEAFTVGKLEGD